MKTFVIQNKGKYYDTVLGWTTLAGCTLFETNEQAEITLENVDYEYYEGSRIVEAEINLK